MMRKKWPGFSSPEFRINNDKTCLNLQGALPIEVTIGDGKMVYLLEDGSLNPNMEGRRHSVRRTIAGSSSF
jgi:hypothetical protein